MADEVLSIRTLIKDKSRDDCGDLSLRAHIMDKHPGRLSKFCPLEPVDKEPEILAPFLDSRVDRTLLVVSFNDKMGQIPTINCFGIFND
jgi:hypothetical protein